MSLGATMVVSLIYLTLVVSLVISLLDNTSTRLIMKETLRRWCKFLLGLIALGVIVQIFTLLG